MRYAHVEGIYRTAYPNVYGDPYDPPNPNFPFLDPSRRTVERFISSRETSKDSFTSDSNAELKFATGPITHKTLFGVDYRGLRERASSGMATIRRRSISMRRSIVASLRPRCRPSPICGRASSGSMRRTRCGLAVAGCPRRPPGLRE